jgi:hypothetical protein
MDKSIRCFLKSVDLPNCRVQNTPRLIFLCGGVVRKSGKYTSARDYFFRYVKSHDSNLLRKIRLAESINDWFDQNVFSDLLELEVILADCADLTVLFVESPGSIAELGAFAASDVLRPRTLAILNSSFKQERTFIADGPVRRIRASDEDLVRYWKWDSKHINRAESLSGLEEMSKELTSLLGEKGKSTVKEQTISKASPGHAMFLIADLLEIVGISYVTEIVDCLVDWSFEVDRKRVQQYLLLLEHLQLVKKERRSNQVYYISRLPAPLIRHAFVADVQMRDRDRWKSVIRKSLAETDERRMAVFRNDLEDRARRDRRHV